MVVFEISFSFVKEVKRDVKSDGVVEVDNFVAKEYEGVIQYVIKYKRRDNRRLL